MPKLSWTTVMERALLQTLVDQVRSGKRAESGFKKEAWVAYLEQVKLVAQHPDLVTLKKSKDKLDNLKAKWNIWVKLRYELSGWGCDETTQLFLASSEQWDRYIETYPKAASLRYTPLLNRDLLEELFDGTVAGGKEAISIHSLTSQIRAEKILDSSSASQDRETQPEENRSDSPEIFPDEWEESLPSTPREQHTLEQNKLRNASREDLGLITLSDTEEIADKSTNPAYSSNKPLMFSDDSSPSIKKNPTNPASGGTKKTIRKPVNLDASSPSTESSMTKKQKSEKRGQKQVRTTGGSLLWGSLDAVVQELKEGRLQRSEEVREEKRQRKMELEEQRIQRLEDAYPPVHRATKLLIKTYGNTKKDLILWALKVFLDEIKAHMFLSLEGEWQEQWLISVCEEARQGKSQNL